MPTMPNVVGLEYPAALQSMIVAGVRAVPFGYFQADPVALSFVKNAAVKPGFVIAQVPAAATPNVAPNSAATLTVSNFPMGIAYPAGGSQV